MWSYSWGSDFAWADCWSEDTTMAAVVGLNTIELKKQNFEELVPSCCFLNSNGGGGGRQKKENVAPGIWGKGDGV